MSYRVAPASTRQRRPLWPPRAFRNNFDTFAHPNSVFTQQFVHLNNFFPLYNVKDSFAIITPVISYKIVHFNNYYLNQSVRRGVRDNFSYRQPIPVLFLYENQPIVSPLLKIDNMGYRYRYFIITLIN